jgi:hypothetical protein
MNRNELAKELTVWPWDVDDWLLSGCPAKKFRTSWDFDLEQVKTWLEGQKIKIKRIRPQPSSKKPTIDPHWFGGGMSHMYGERLPWRKGRKGLHDGGSIRR